MPNSRHLRIWLSVAVVALAAAAWRPAAAQGYAPALPVVPSPPSAPVPSGTPVDISLTEAVAIGLRDNRDIQSAYLQRVVQKFDLFVAQTQFLPVARISAQAVERRGDGPNDDNRTASVGADASWFLPTGGSVNFSWGQLENLDSDTTDRSRTTTLSVNQPLLRGAGLDVNLAPLRMARMREKMNRLALDQTVSNTVTMIVFSYRALLQSQQQVELAELSLERTRELLDTNKAMIEAGRMAAADIVQTESQVANQEVALLQARRQRESAQLTLSRHLGLDPRSNLVAADRIKVEKLTVDMDQALALAFDARMDIMGQRIAVEQARQALRIAKNNRLWDVSVGASVTRREDVDPILGRLEPETNSTVSVRLGIPIGDFGPQQGELRAETGLKQAELRYEDITEAVAAQVRDAVQTVEMGWLQLEAARRARALTLRAFEIQQEKLKAGRSSNFEVLSFQADLRAADSQELSASIAYLNALTALDQQIGSTLETWRISLND